MTVTTERPRWHNWLTKRRDRMSLPEEVTTTPGRCAQGVYPWLVLWASVAGPFTLSRQKEADGRQNFD